MLLNYLALCDTRWYIKETCAASYWSNRLKMQSFPIFQIPAKTCYQITALLFINCNVVCIPCPFIISLDQAHAENVLACNWPLTEIEASRTLLKHISIFLH